ncbi:hypothetical protein HYZ41_01155 [archaeon]|nr:hypothetical protein [archaeon]
MYTAEKLEERRQHQKYQAYRNAENDVQIYLDDVKNGEGWKIDSISSVLNSRSYCGITYSKAVDALVRTRSPKAYEPLLKVAGGANPYTYSEVTYKFDDGSTDVYDPNTVAIKWLARTSGKKALKHFVREFEKDQPYSNPYVISRFILEGVNPGEEKDDVIAAISKPLLQRPTRCDEIIYADALRKVDNKAAEIVAKEIDSWKFFYINDNFYYRNNDCAKDITATLIGQ